MKRIEPSTLARCHGAFNVVGGLWPLLHLPSFEAVFGPKTDKWLVRTVAGLLVANGVAQLQAAGTKGRRKAGSLDQARRVGIGTAITLAAIDLIYVPKGRISKMYLADAAAEIAWLIAWRSRKRDLLS